MGQEILGHGTYESEKLGTSDSLSIVSDNSAFVLMPEGLPTSIVDNIIIAGQGMKLGPCFGQARAGTSHRCHLVPCRAYRVGAAAGLAAGHAQESGIWQTTEIS